MTDVVLRLTANPGTYRLGLFDHQRRLVVAVALSTPARRLEVGDSWVVRDGDEPSMSVLIPFTFDEALPGRYGYCLADVEDAARVSLPDPAPDLDAELRSLLGDPPADPGGGRC